MLRIEKLFTTFSRSRFYTCHVRKHFVVGNSLRKHNLKPIRIGNIFIIPTNGLNRLDGLYKMYKLAGKICREDQVDIIQTADPTFTGFIGYLMKRKYGKSLNVWVLGHDPYDDNWLRERGLNALLAPISKHVLQACDGVQVDGKKVAKNLIRRGRIPHSKVSYIPNVPPDIKYFRNADGRDVRHRLLTANETRLLLFVGRLTKQKNIHFLITCFSRIVEQFPTARLVIIGEGEEESSLKRAACKLGIADRITWIGFVPVPPLAEYFAAADVFVLCSLFEGFPQVLMEAAMAGTPIVSTDVGGVEEVIRQGKSGFVIRQGDVEQFAEKTLFLLNKPEIARKMGMIGRQIVSRQLDRRQMIIRQIEVWCKLVGRVGYTQRMNAEPTTDLQLNHTGL